MFRYALINNDGFVYGESFLSGEVDSPNMILVDEGFSLENKKYINGVWAGYIPESTPEILLTDQEQSILETAINTEYLVALADLGL